MELKPLGLIDRAALAHLESKKLAGAFNHYDVWLDQHAYAFSVAKMLDEDLLTETRHALADALKNGTSFREFKQLLKPYLMAKGWWGEQVLIDPMDDESKLVQLGSDRRLKLIFQTNIATAHAASRWERIQANKRGLPYLRYNASHAKDPREAHQRYYGLILPVEHEIWQQIFPPNGYNCKCSVTQLTRRQAEREGISPEPDFEFVDVENPRTGEVVRVPRDIDPSFAHNHVNRVENVVDLAGEKYGAEFAKKLKLSKQSYLQERGKVDIFESSESIIAEGMRLFDKHRDTIISALERGEPHKGIMEVMNLEGVETGADVLVKSHSTKLASEFIESILAYPKTWVEMTNQQGKVCLEGKMGGRAFHRYLTQSGLNKIIQEQSDLYELYKTGFEEQWYQAGDSLVYSNLLSSDIIRKSTYVHEFAHRLQNIFPELNQLFVRLWHERTKGDIPVLLSQLVPNSHYRPNEICKPDHFPDPYYGKMYGNEKSPEPREMIAMIFESLLGGHEGRFAQLASSPDLFHFGLALLVRWKI